MGAWSELTNVRLMPRPLLCLQDVKAARARSAELEAVLEAAQRERAERERPSMRADAAAGSDAATPAKAEGEEWNQEERDALRAALADAEAQLAAARARAAAAEVEGEDARRRAEHSARRAEEARAAADELRGATGTIAATDVGTSTSSHEVGSEAAVAMAVRELAEATTLLEATAGELASTRAALRAAEAERASLRAEAAVQRGRAERAEGRAVGRAQAMGVMEDVVRLVREGQGELRAVVDAAWSAVAGAESQVASSPQETGGTETGADADGLVSSAGDEDEGGSADWRATVAEHLSRAASLASALERQFSQIDAAMSAPDNPGASTEAVNGVGRVGEGVEAGVQAGEGAPEERSVGTGMDGPASAASVGVGTDTVGKHDAASGEGQALAASVGVGTDVADRRDVASGAESTGQPSQPPQAQTSAPVDAEAVDALRAALADVRAELRVMQEALSMERQRLTTAEAEAAQLREELASAERASTLGRLDIDALKEALAQERAMVGALAAELAQVAGGEPGTALMGRVREAEAALETARQERAMLEARVADAEGLAESWRRERDAMEARVAEEVAAQRREGTVRAGADTGTQVSHVQHTDEATQAVVVHADVAACTQAGPPRVADGARQAGVVYPGFTAGTQAGPVQGTDEATQAAMAPTGADVGTQSLAQSHSSVVAQTESQRGEVADAATQQGATMADASVEAGSHRSSATAATQARPDATSAASQADGSAGSSEGIHLATQTSAPDATAVGDPRPAIAVLESPSQTAASTQLTESGVQAAPTVADRGCDAFTATTEPTLAARVTAAVAAASPSAPPTPAPADAPAASEAGGAAAAGREAELRELRAQVEALRHLLQASEAQDLSALMDLVGPSEHALGTTHGATPTATGVNLPLAHSRAVPPPPEPEIVPAPMAAGKAGQATAASPVVSPSPVRSSLGTSQMATQARSPGPSPAPQHPGAGAEGERLAGLRGLLEASRQEAEDASRRVRALQAEVSWRDHAIHDLRAKLRAAESGKARERGAGAQPDKAAGPPVASTAAKAAPAGAGGAPEVTADAVATRDTQTLTESAGPSAVGDSEAQARVGQLESELATLRGVVTELQGALRVTRGVSGVG